MEFSSLSSRWIEQQDDDKEARVMYERERKIFSINLSSAVPVSSVGNGTDVMVDRGRLLSLVNVCVCTRAFGCLHLNGMQYLLFSDGNMGLRTYRVFLFCFYGESWSLGPCAYVCV